MTAFLKDTRRFKRLNVHIPITFSVQSDSVKLRDKEEIKGVVENLSAGGALIRTPIFIPKGSVVELDIDIKELIPDLPQKIKVESKIIHTQAKVTSLQVGEEKTFNMGVEFLNLDPKQQEMINNFIKKAD